MNARILILDDEEKMGKALRHVLAKEGYTVEALSDPHAALRQLEAQPCDLLLCDLKMPGLSGLDVLERSQALQPNLIVLMMTAYASTETAIESMKKGAWDYLIKPFSTDELKILVARCLKTRSLERENSQLRERVRERFQPRGLIAASKPMRALLERTRKAAESRAAVLITGESGSGKEMLAQILHQASPRSQGPFIAVNCGALTETLLESELFGHRAGSFTGATENREGLFQAADGGTIFLDEIGEVSPAMQVKLLRVLQSGEIQRVGEPRALKTDARVVAATNRDLEAMVAEGSFRTDLFYRLNVVPLAIPPLRERREDIAPLVEHFLARYGAGRPFRFQPEAFACLEQYDWPGNVRELENAIEHAVVMAEDQELGLDSLPFRLRQFAGERQSATLPTDFEHLTLAEVEQRLILAALERCNDNMTQAARQLGITRRTLGYRLRKYGLYERFRAQGDEDPDTPEPDMPEPDREEEQP